MCICQFFIPSLLPQSHHVPGRCAWTWELMANLRSGIKGLWEIHAVIFNTFDLRNKCYVQFLDLTLIWHITFITVFFCILFHAYKIQVFTNFNVYSSIILIALHDVKKYLINFLVFILFMRCNKYVGSKQTSTECNCAMRNLVFSRYIDKSWFPDVHIHMH